MYEFGNSLWTNPLVPELRGLQAEPIKHGQGELIAHRDQLAELVEVPALAACQELFDKNIRTISASANYENVVAYIDIDYATLSPENQQRALELGQPIVTDQEGNFKAVKLAVPVTQADTEEMVAAKLTGLSQQFEPQPLLWAPTYTLDEIKAVYGMTADDQATPEAFVAEGFYYDEESQSFYLSEELFLKLRG